ncbi:uncharacterized protein LOC109820563 [Asparagus officinalis]|uniref:uncharacterized protein LOC109820563 n=1 Tax=Asparagus officinalis TaxID=4686 RepID=UPI00098E456E|nr:uncharacterized protein LOC109820563 [Asparagus officinalis]
MMWEKKTQRSGSEEENESTMSSFDSPGQMPEASNSSHCFKNQEEKLLMDCAREAGAKVHYKHGHLSSDIREKDIHEKILAWQRIQGGMSSLLKLLGSDISELRNEWSQFRAEVSVVGVQMEASIFEEIVDETVLEILGIHCI